MIRIFIILTVLFLGFHTVAFAQVAAPAPARVDMTPAITQVVGGCARAGDMLTLQGRNLNKMTDQKPALRNNTQTIYLDVLSRAEGKFTVRIPLDTALKEGKKYPLVLADEDKAHVFTETGLTVTLCAMLAAPVKPAPIKPAMTKNVEILVLVDADQKQSVRDTLSAQNYNVVRERNLTTLGFYVAVLSVAQGSLNKTIADLRGLLPDAQIDLNRSYTPAGAPRLYAPEKISWPNTGAACLDKVKNIPLGIIDGGVDQSHSAFAGSTMTAKNFLEDAPADSRHGTAVASVLVGKTGLVHESPLYAAVVLRDNGDKLPTASTEAIARALDWLMGQRVRLINVSLAAPKSDRILTSLFKAAIKSGAIVFAAVGNAGPNAAPSYPAAIEDVIGITATDAADRVYVNANQGDYVDFAAPGVDVWLADTAQGGVYKSGTSYAAPYAMAVAALILARNREVPRDLVVKALQETSKDLGATGRDNVFGHGLVQVGCG